ncbi:hypothetical protein D9M70_490380 [compost metagenome]
MILEAEAIEHVHRTHGDAFGSALGIDRSTIDRLSVDLPFLEEFGDVLEFGKGLRHGKVATVLALEFRLQLGAGEPVLAVAPADDVAECRQRPVVR